MKYKEGSFGTRADATAFLKRAVSELLAGRLVVEGQPVELPEDADLDFEAKYKTEETGGSVVFKIAWSIDVPEEEPIVDDNV